MVYQSASFSSYGISTCSAGYNRNRSRLAAMVMQKECWSVTFSVFNRSSIALIRAVLLTSDWTRWLVGLQVPRSRMGIERSTDSLF